MIKNGQNEVPQTGVNLHKDLHFLWDQRKINQWYIPMMWRIFKREEHNKSTWQKLVIMNILHWCIYSTNVIYLQFMRSFLSTPKYQWCQTFLDYMYIYSLCMYIVWTEDIIKTSISAPPWRAFLSCVDLIIWLIDI